MLKDKYSPWKVGDLVQNDSEVRHINIIGNDGVKLIGKATFGHINECTAIAHLMAASPELLEGCILGLNIIEQCINYESISDSDAKIIEEKRIQISNAIKKAKGGGQ
jgi:hypothetical protein